MAPLFILFIHLGVGGVERKIVDTVNFLGSYKPDLPVYILVRKKSNFDLSTEIKNKNVKVINYQKWVRVKIPYFFPVFVIYQVWKLKPKSILAFLDFVSLPSVLAKLIFFWRKTTVVLSEDHYSSKIIPTYRFGHIREFLVRILYPRANIIFTCTEANKKDLVLSYGIPSNKIKIIRNWTTFENQNNKEVRKKFDLIYVGRLAKTKNLDYLIERVSDLKKDFPEIKLCLVGSGEEEEKLKRKVRELNLTKNITFVGATHDVSGYLSKAKIFVFSSQIEAEGFPLVILEAMAVGLPVLSRDFSGAKEFLKDGENCYLFKTEEDFLRKVRFLLNNPKEREKITFKAKKYVKKYHSPKNMLDYFKELGIKK